MNKVRTFFFLIFKIAVSYSNAQELDATYYFAQFNGDGCTKYENAILREAGKLALSMAQEYFFDTPNDQTAEYAQFVLHKHDDEVPHIEIISYDLATLSVDLDISAEAMEVFLRNNTIIGSHDNSDSEDVSNNDGITDSDFVSNNEVIIDSDDVSNNEVIIDRDDTLNSEGISDSDDSSDSNDNSSDDSSKKSSLRRKREEKKEAKKIKKEKKKQEKEAKKIQKKQEKEDRRNNKSKDQSEEDVIEDDGSNDMNNFMPLFNNFDELQGQDSDISENQGGATNYDDDEYSSDMFDGGGKCCRCSECKCCSWGGCKDQCYQRRRMTPLEDCDSQQVQHTQHAEQILIDFGIPFFKMVNVSCINPDDLKVMISSC